MNLQPTFARRLSLRSGPARALSALALLFAVPAGSAFASWLTIAEIPRTSVTVSMQTEGRVPRSARLNPIESFFRSAPPPASAWFLFNYPAPVATSESFTFRSYKEHVVADCDSGTIGMDQFIAFGGQDGGGHSVTSWVAPDAPLDLRPAVPGTIGAIMFNAVCSGPAPFPVKDVLLQPGAAPAAAPSASASDAASATAIPSMEPQHPATQLQ
ncbi:Surface-adhesin protein E-like domain-containing protein [Pararobbsia alpina]|uniref:surface-adhesin E family protein n=1 Tax=Pararobbsia alpina TaxID=621374 RepID=UPI0039A59578